MESKKWLALALVLVALLGSLEYMPRNILLRIAIPSNASYPLNNGPFGTSELWDFLRQKGFKTSIIYGYSGLPRVRGIKDVVFLDIGGASTSEPSEAYKIINQYIREGVKVHFIMLDEKPTREIWNLLVNTSLAICDTIPPKVGGPLNSTFNDLYLTTGEKDYDLPTGYTGYIIKNESPIVSPGKPSLPMQLGDYTAIAAAWPYANPPFRGNWYIVGVECRGDKGSIVIIADSTIAINLEGNSHPEALTAIEGIIKSRISSPNTTLILVDEEFYVQPGEGNLQLILSLHPSVFLLAFSRVYSAIESLIVHQLARRGLLPLLIAGFTAILLSASLYSTRLTTKEHRKTRKTKKSKSLKDILPSLGIGFWKDTIRICEKASIIVPLSSGRGPTRGILDNLIESVEKDCNRIKKSLILRYIPIWGSLKRRVLVNASLALSLAGVYSYKRALKVLEGDSEGE